MVHPLLLPLEWLRLQTCWLPPWFKGDGNRTQGLCYTRQALYKLRNILCTNQDLSQRGRGGEHMCVTFLGSLVTKYKQPSCSSHMKALPHSLADSKVKTKVMAGWIPSEGCDSGLPAILGIPRLEQPSPISIVNAPHCLYVNTAPNFLLIACFIDFLSQG